MLAGALFLTACSHNSSLPPFTASGFAEDQGAVRIWRKDSGDNVHLLAVFSPWRSGDTTTREYRWQGDNLTLININVYSKPPVNIRARFDDRGDLSFMQRESDGEKQQLSNDQIDLYRYRADQIRQISDALRQGRVVLRQGRWHAMEQTVTTCEGQTIKPDLDSQAIAHIERRQSRSSVDVSVAWLERPKVRNYCWWQTLISVAGNPTRKRSDLPVAHTHMTATTAAAVTHSGTARNTRFSHRNISFHP